MVARSKAWVCDRSRTGIVVSNPAGAWVSFSCECRMLLGRGCCVGLITRPEESYGVWCVWVWSWILDNEEALAHWGCCKKTRENFVSNVALWHIHTHVCHAVVRFCGQLMVRSWGVLQQQSWMEVEVGRKADMRRPLCCVKSNFYFKKKGYICKCGRDIPHATQTLALFGCLRRGKSICIVKLCRSQWPRGLRRRSAAACLLRLWVRIP